MRYFSQIQIHLPILTALFLKRSFFTHRSFPLRWAGSAGLAITGSLMSILARNVQPRGSHPSSLM